MTAWGIERSRNSMAVNGMPARTTGNDMVTTPTTKTRTRTLALTNHGSKSFCHWLVRRRKELGITQAELAAAAGVSLSCITKAEGNIHRPSTANLRKLAVGLRVTREEIMAAAEGREVEAERVAPGEGLPADVAARLEALAQRMSIPRDELLRIACDVLERVYRR